MARYLKTFYQGFPLYYAGNAQNKIRLEPQKHNAVLFISQKAAECVAKNLAEKYLRNDFFVVQQRD
ncbi:hypothetical protein BHOIPH791_15050 [Bartonella henselae]|uniref:Uncharacterized protein n=2 Tax=Bartonella TaxID=773 RepID=A0A0H3M464_BARHE|nr:hypothetical protein [Bartonella henselae]ATP12867.1 hypothetical protein BhenCHDE101_07400 [Bartonella henselae]ETS05886.1 hypothetical protein Q654_01433 [Bartonella henselae JK 50]ETS06057.1 hypothetical protein Q655_01381 [Bartonella henselae JK 51]MDM9991520.1 hypothetical protein [Bartonella henselae]OLL39207.1 hypothetical protein AT237_07645 [Bartonella henselae]